MAFRFLALIASALQVSAFQLPKVLQTQAQKLAAPALAAAVTLHSEAAHAKSVLGVNGALDFGPLAGDQPGGEGTGKVRVPPSIERIAPPSTSAHGRVRESGAREDNRASLLRQRCARELLHKACVCSAPCSRAWRDGLAAPRGMLFCTTARAAPVSAAHARPPAWHLLRGARIRWPCPHQAD